MKASNELFLLIKSLNKTEKSYFKKKSSNFIKNKENYYVRIFNLIDKQTSELKEYDEEKIKKNLKDQKLINSLPVFKNYLYNEILKSLSMYYTGSNKNLELKDYLKMTEILFQKGMISQCKKLLKKAKDFAYKNDKLLAVLEILNWEIKINLNLLNYGVSQSEIETLNEEAKQITLKILNLQEYQELQLKFTLLNQKTKFLIPDEELKKEYKKLLSNKLLKDVKNAQSFAAKNIFYQIHLLYLNSTSDYKIGYDICKDYVELIEKDNKIEDNKKSYLSALNNYLIRCLYLRKFDEFKTSFIKYQNKTLSAPDIQAYLLSYNLNLYYYQLTGDFEKAISLFPQIEKDFVRYKGRFHKIIQLYLYYNFAYLLFITEDYYKCINYLNLILNDEVIKSREDLLFFSKILFLLSHYELKNYDLVESLIKSLYIYIIKKKRMFNFENNIIRFFKKLVNITDEESLKEGFGLLKSELIKQMKAQSDDRTLDYFDYVSWLESKITNTPFKEILQKKSAV